MENSSPKSISLKRMLLSVLCVLLVLILSALIFVCVYMDSLLSRVDRVSQEQQTLSPSELLEIQATVETREPGYTGPVYDPTDITWPSEPAPTIPGENVINILLIGQDRRSGQTRQRSDAMILCTINVPRKTLTLTSFLRDMYVQIPGYYNNKINLAYQIGGMPLLDEVLKVNFGVQVDGNIEVDFSQFEKIIDLLGGVDIELTGAEANYINNNIHTALRAGMNHLDGEAALQYSRIRYIGTDFGRTERQRKVLTALVGEFKNVSITQAHTLLGQICELVTTDMTDAQILKYAMALLPMLSEISVQSQRVPMDGTYSYGDVKDIVHCIFVDDFETNRQMLVDTLAE